MAKRISDEIASEETKNTKADTENNLDKTVEELADAEAEKFLILLDKTFNDHHEKKLNNKNNENNANLDCEDGSVSDILIKIEKKYQRTHLLI